MTTATEKAIQDREKASRAAARKKVRGGEKAMFDLDEYLDDEDEPKPAAKAKKS